MNGDSRVISDDSLDPVTLRVYLYIIKKDAPVGPRDVMRGVDLSSPSVAHRHLQKLLSLGLLRKDNYGMYLANGKASFGGYFWLGKNLVPRLVLYSLFFVGLLIVETALVSVHMCANQPVTPTLIFLVFVTGVSATLFLSEGMRLKRKMSEFF